MKKLIFNFDYTLHPWSHRLPWNPAFQLMEALRQYFDVYRRDEIPVEEADFVFNTQPSVLDGGAGKDIFLKGRHTSWWDLTPLEHIDSHYFDKCDVVFYNTPSLAEKYPLEKRQLLLEPVDYLGYYYQPQEFKYDIGHLGSERVPWRINLLNELQTRYNLLRGQYEMGPVSSKLLSQCKLVLSIQDYWEQNAYIERRFFTFGNVRPILVHFNPDYESIGKPLEHYIPYVSYEELFKQIDYYLKHEAEREQIGKNLQAEFWNKHRPYHRAKQVYETLCPSR